MKLPRKAREQHVERIKAVCPLLGVDYDTIISTGRMPGTVRARIVVAAILRDAGLSYNNIADIMCGTHSTAMHQVKRHAELMATDEQYRADFGRVLAGMPVANPPRAIQPEERRAPRRTAKVLPEPTKPPDPAPAVCAKSSAFGRWRNGVFTPFKEYPPSVKEEITRVSKYGAPNGWWVKRGDVVQGAMR